MSGGLTNNRRAAFIGQGNSHGSDREQSETDALTNSVVASWGTIGGGGIAPVSYVCQANPGFGQCASCVGGPYAFARCVVDAQCGSGGVCIPDDNACQAFGPCVGTFEANRVVDEFGFIGGGGGNVAGSDDPFTTNAPYANIGGGVGNIASGTAATVAGGAGNSASATHAFVGGGSWNVASGINSVVVGGTDNHALGTNSMVLGGTNCSAGGVNSFAGGRFAAVRTAAEVGMGDTNGDEGSFVWADSDPGPTFQTTGPNQFLIRADGGVGINTADPDVPLEIAGGTELSLTDGTGHLMIGDQDSVNLALDQNEIQARNNAAAADFLINPAGGEVGIGTGAPLATQHINNTTDSFNSNALENDDVIVRATDAVIGLYSSDEGTWGSAIALKELAADGTIQDTWGIARQTTTSGDGSLRITYGTSDNYATNTAPLVINTSGNVGIGTTDVDVRFEVNGGNELSLADGTGYVIVGDQDGANLAFDTNEIQARSNGVAADLQLNSAGGNVGINTTAALSRPLTIQGDGGNSDWLQFRTSAGVDAWHISNQGPGLNFVETNVSANRLVLEPGGDVGIGRVPSANTLEVEGNASKTLMGDWAANSDRRIKKDIESVSNALDTLDRVRLVSFKYTDEYRRAHPIIEDHEYLSVIAQEFQEIFPDWVHDGGDSIEGVENILQVDTFPLTIYSAAAVQELNEVVKDQKAQIADLATRLAAMEKLLVELASARKAGQ